MSAPRLTLLTLCAALVACDDFDGLGERAACRSGLPSCPDTDAGSADGGLDDAGTRDAGTDAGPVDAGVADAGVDDAGAPDAGPIDAGNALRLDLVARWTAREGGLYQAGPSYRSGLAAMDGGFVRWLASTTNPADVFDGPPGDLVGGYGVVLQASTGQWLASDGGVGVRTGESVLTYLNSYVSPPNVSRGRATIAKTELLSDGGVPRYSDGGTTLSDGGPLQFSNLNATQGFRLDTTAESLIAYALPALPLAAGQVELLDGGRAELTVFRGTSRTQWVLSGSSTTSLGYDCQALPLDIVTTHATLDRVLTLSVCIAAHVLEYSESDTPVDLSLGAATSARMGIAPEAVANRAPFVAAALSAEVSISRLTAAGNAIAKKVNLVSTGVVPSVEALAVDGRNRPVVVLGAAPGQRIAVEGVDGGVVSNSGLILVGLDEELSVLWAGPLLVANGEVLRASAAVFSGNALLVGVDCAAATLLGICEGSRSPSLIKVGVFPSQELP